MNSPEEIIKIVQAHIDGKTIQYKMGNEWIVAKTPVWSFHTTHYRVKPEPEEFMVRRCGNKICSCEFASCEKAENKMFRVREVLDE